MENYRTGAHTRYDIKYHFVWITKYRKPVLTGAVGLRLRDLVREICRTHDIEILQGAISSDHVHVLLSCPPERVTEQDHAVYQGEEFPKTDDGIQAYPKTVLGSPLVGTRILRGVKW